MANIRWTDEQSAILKATGNILVSAAAGSGKTAVLTERIVRKVEEGTNICNMLVVTFTSAAANEMKQRIEQKLYERVESEQDSQKRAYLYAQAASTSRADISTLHSFCSHVLKRHFYEAKLPPNFRVGDDTELQILKDEALDEALNVFFSADDSNSSLIDFFNGEANLISIVLDIYNAIQTMADGDIWFNAAIENYNTDEKNLINSKLFSEISASTRELVELALAYSKAAVEFANDGKPIEILQERMSFFEQILNVTEDYSQCRSIIMSKLRTYSGQKNLSLEFKNLNALAGECIKRAKENYALSLEEHIELLHNAYPYMQKLKELVTLFTELFAKKKAERALIDFQDMEQKALALLRNQSIANIYKQKFQYVFVDEYQDINKVQDEIIRLLLGNDNAFFVGDIKQSIYRFRRAKPELFIEKSKLYSTLENSCCLNLNANFRSSDSVVNFTNSVFQTLMRAETGGITYDETNSLKKLSACTIGHVSVNFIETDSAPVFEASQNEQESDLDADSVDSAESLLAAQSQAALIAQTIKDMIENREFFDIKENRTRKFTYSDFAILMRSPKIGGDIIAKELLLEGIPVYIQSSGGYYSSLEIQILVNLLSIIDNRQQDIPLLSVMRSVIGGFDINELAVMRNKADMELADGKRKNIFEMLTFAAQSDDGIGKKAQLFLAQLDKWYEESKLMSLEEFIRMLYDETGYYRFIRSLPNGSRRAANLLQFANIAANYESNINKGLYDFLMYIESAKAHSDTGSAAEIFADCVKILTMHKSKGLEFNAVIIPLLDKKVISVSPSKSLILFGEEPVLGTKFALNGTLRTDIFYKLLCERTNRALIADELRLLYVALTRARDTIILISSCKSTEKRAYANDVPGENIPATILKTSSTYMDWILLALLNSKSNRPILETALAKHYAQNDFVSVSITPHYVYKLPEQDTDRSYFYTALDRIKQCVNDEITAQLTWKYPNSQAVNIVSKGSVTGFAAHQVQVKYSNEAQPYTANKVSAAQRGTVTHSIFELLPLKKHTPKSVADFVKALYERGEITKDEANSLNINGIAAFYNRELAARMMQSNKILLEQEFACFVEAKFLSDEYPGSNEQVLLQGIIDCAFMENGEWIIVDYKTDSVNANDAKAVEEKAKTHKKQLKLYAYVLNKITGIKVSQAYIAFVNAYDVRVF